MSTKGVRDFLLVEGIAKSIGPDRLLAAFKTVLIRHGINPGRLHNRGVPRFTVSTEKVVSKHSESFISGSYAGGYEFKIYSAGMAHRRSLGFSVKLSVLEVFIHECLHALAGRKEFLGGYQDDYVQYDAKREVTGYHEYFVIDRTKHTIANELFDEGVTQSLTTEVMFEFLRNGRFLGVSDKKIEHHFWQVTNGISGSFYPYAVTFVSALAERLGEDGSVASARAEIYRGYFKGTSLLNDAEWVERLELAGVHDIMHKARMATLEELPSYEKKLRRGRDVWDGLTIVSEKILVP